MKQNRYQGLKEHDEMNEFEIYLLSTKIQLKIINNSNN